MIDILRRVEEKLVRAEGWLLVFLVSLMLFLAVYNVVYRNALVPLQAWLTIDDTPAESKDVTVPPQPTLNAPKPEVVPAAGDGFGGDFGEKPAEVPVADDNAGFGGDFGEKPAEAPVADDNAGFGGDFGEKPTVEKNGDEGGFGGDFGGKPTPSGTEAKPVVDVVETPHKELSATAKFVDQFVMAVKLEWIDVLLRHLVLVVGFLGAMLATQRRKHITIDALSKVMPTRFLPWIEAITSLLATVICGFLASSGAGLVAISREFPKELTAWADEWVFQLVFPVGFALLGFHFAVRVLESIGHGLSMAEQRGEA